MLALTRPGGVFTLGVWCFSGFASLFPLVFAAIYWKRTTKAGAYAAVLVAAISWIVLFALGDFGANRSYLFLGMMPVATMVILSTIALVVVSLLTPAPSAATINKFFAAAPGAKPAASVEATGPPEEAREGLWAKSLP